MAGKEKKKQRKIKVKTKEICLRKENSKKMLPYLIDIYINYTYSSFSRVGGLGWCSNNISFFVSYHQTLPYFVLIL